MEVKIAVQFAIIVAYKSFYGYRQDNMTFSKILVELWPTNFISAQVNINSTYTSD